MSRGATVLELRRELAACFAGTDPFAAILDLEGTVYRQMDGRRTLRFERGGRGYFAKIYRGVGWREIVKNLACFRLPVIDATTELRAIRRLGQLGVATMTVAGYGRRGLNPARRESFLITDELVGMPSLETFCRDWAGDPPSPRLKRALLDEVAAMARALHGNGVNHRDFYLCHFLLDQGRLQRSPDAPQVRLHLIDLHRMQIRRRTPVRWIVKDLGGLLFSSFAIGLTTRDLFRFARAYRRQPLRVILAGERGFWLAVARRALKFYRRDFGAAAVVPGIGAKVLKWM